MLRQNLIRFLRPLAGSLARGVGLRVYDHQIKDFYWAVPDQGTISDAALERVSELPGLRMNERQQLELLDRLIAGYKSEWDAFPDAAPAEPNGFYWRNGSFGNHDAVLLYGLLRELRPKRLIEIGAGTSTRLAATAIRRNQAEGWACRFTSVDPYPDDAVAAGFPGLDELVRSPVQDVPLGRFAELDAGDILFIDSSHVLHIGSDVQYELLEVIPRLRPGVYVHVHDIFFPREYPRHLVRNGRFWDEQYLLQAFLAFNDSFEVVWAGSYINHRHPAAMVRALSWYDPAGNQPGSFWMKRVR